jgi:hypothetical protein
MKYWLPFALLLVSGAAHGQVIAMELDKQNLLYVGIENPVTVAVEGYSCKSIFLTTDNGSITGQNGHYVLTPATPSHTMAVQINAKTASGIKELGVKTFRAKCAPSPVVRLMGKSGGNIKASIIHMAIAPIAYFDGFEYDAHILIDKVTITMIRNGATLFERSMRSERGVRFTDDDDVQKMIQSLRPHDVLRLDGLTYANTVRACSQLPPLEFTIVE